MIRNKIMKKAMNLSCLWAIGLVILGVNLNPNPVEAAISCNEAVVALMPCLPYLKASAPGPAIACCQGALKVSKLADTTQVRRDLCECFKKAAPSLGVDPQRAKDLPHVCSVKVPVPIDPKVECSSIPYAAGFV